MGTSSIIILAAGCSSRMGSPKQLLQYQGKTLLRRAAETALATHTSSVLAVLGFESDRMKRELDNLPIQVVHNPEWREGIASSIRKGLASLLPTTDVALIMLCDQPLVTSDLLLRLIAACNEQAPIAATGYDQTSGVPACYGRSLFPELLELKNDQGAKLVIRQDPARVSVIPFPDANVDIDTIDDYRRHIESAL